MRFHHMKQRYGVDPQFPVRRYISGLSSAKVPSRAGEHAPLVPYNDTPREPGPYVPFKDDYLGNNDCDNPLFSMDLPTDPGAELCHLKPGPRSRDLVVFGVITGVPSELLTTPLLGPAEWTKILGKDPLHFDVSGIDPHMVQSAAPRPGLAGVTAPDDADPIHGRERETGGGDLQFACTFELDTPIDCTAPDQRACECSPLSDVTGSTLCGKGSAKTTQIRGKAYPGVRQLEVAQALGTRAIVSSLCPVHVKEITPGDPLVGYRSAMVKLGDRMARSLIQPE